MNQVSSMLDASNVYGSTKEQADKLRDLSDPGKLSVIMSGKVGDDYVNCHSLVKIYLQFRTRQDDHDEQRRGSF